MDQQTNRVWGTPTDQLEPSELAFIARSMKAARKALHGPLPSDFIHDPVLDMLLHLFIAHVAITPVAEEVLVASTSVRPSVASRWISASVQEGIMERERDVVSLTAQGLDSVIEILRAVSRSQASL